MRRIIGAVLIALLLVGMAGLGAWQLLGGSGGAVLSRDASPIGRGASTPTDLTTVRGVVGSEKKAFFSDPEVERIFAQYGLAVEVDTAGSREIATSTVCVDQDHGLAGGARCAAASCSQARLG